MLQENFLVIEGNSVRLLGYPLPLSPKERQILSAIMTCPCPTATRIAALPQISVSRPCLAVHISSINRKAKRIGGRPLVEIRNGMYRLNPFM